MALQSTALVMAGLSVEGDVPPHTLQPQLVDGIYLRWMFERSRGFPWYGYYLFRRIRADEGPIEGDMPGPRPIVPDGGNMNPLLGWRPLPDFPDRRKTPAYPLCLPVFNPDYPCPGAPMSSAGAQAVAAGRVVYDPVNSLAGFNHAELRDVLDTLVAGGPGGPPMETKQFAAPAGPPPALSDRSALDLLLVGSLHPALAQMLGLYWVDQTAVPAARYDYLIVADHQGVLGGTAASALAFIQSQGFGQVDAYIVYDLSLDTPDAPLTPPGAVRGFALPGGSATVPGAPSSDAGAAGLTWQRPASATLLAAQMPLFYHVWRAGLGNAVAPATPGPYAPLTAGAPVLLADPLTAAASPVWRPADWPPSSIPLHYIDRGLAEGWYGYRVSGVDIFGRHSAQGPPAPWWQWGPPLAPPPWYYQPGAGDAQLHPSALRLLDKIPPPPPTGVEAFALDPDDPTLLRDAAYTAWRNALPPGEEGTVGLRVRWRWPQTHMDQAPDTREFRIYAQPGRLNALLGNTVAVTAAGPVQSVVQTDIANAYPAGAYVGARLQVRADSFRIVASAAGTPLVVTVENIGVMDELAPPAAAPCTVVIPDTSAGAPPHPLYVDYGIATSWAERAYVVDYNQHVAEDFVLSADAAGAVLGGNAATLSGAAATLDGAADLSGAGVAGSWLRLAADTARADRLYRVIDVDDVARTVELDGVPALPAGGSAWEIGRKLRRYEVLLPDAGDTWRGGAPLDVPSYAEPVTWATIGVTAADDRPHTADHAQWAAGRWGGPARYGNEGWVGPVAKIYRVLRGAPPAPAGAPYGDDPVYASRADYHARSFFTFRWVPVAGLQAHVFRALDDTLFQVNALLRGTRAALNPATATHGAIFPAGWSAARGSAAAAELNGITSQADYAGLSADARELLGRLPGNQGVAWGGGLAERDWEIRSARQSLDTAPGAPHWPPEWQGGDPASVQRRQDVATALDAVATPAGYAGLSLSALRVLAALPGNESAFTQLTVLPLHPADPANADRRGPDSPDGYAPDPALRAWVDTLDGRTSSRYFYRAAFVDGAHNRSLLGAPTPPVHLPDVVPPRAPVLVRVVGGDRKVTVAWASNREPDLAEYRVYRGDDEAQARDVRLMTRVQTIVVAPGGDPTTRPAEVACDDVVPGRRTFFYRVTAADTSGNESPPTAAVAARAFDDTRPAHPVWDPAQPDGVTNEVALTWTSSLSDLTCLVQRADTPQGTWTSVSGWLPRGTYAYTDADRLPGTSFQYRLRVMDAAGRANDVFVVLTV